MRKVSSIVLAMSLFIVLDAGNGLTSEKVPVDPEVAGLNEMESIAKDSDEGAGSTVAEFIAALILLTIGFRLYALVFRRVWTSAKETGRETGDTLF